MEIENLIKEIKHFSKKINRIKLLRTCGFKYKDKLVNDNSKNSYNLHLNYGRIDVDKVSITTVHNESGKVLVRLDLNPRKHINPDGTIVDTDHVHIYKEGYDERFAYPLDSEEFKNIFPDKENMALLLKSYLDFIKTISIPEIIEVLKF